MIQDDQNAGVSDVTAFDTLDRVPCIEGWRKRFGHSPPKYVSVQFMRKALAFEEQIRAFGGHSTAVRKALAKALKDDRKQSARAKIGKSGSSSASPSPTIVLRPGTHLVREWNGRSYQVEVLEDGFRMDGRTYRSLSAVAAKITDAHWSGPRFFGVG